MILDKQTENLVIEDGDVQESTDMVLDLDSATFLMQMLSKFYSDAIGSLIRETASNALDSHRAAKVDDPIIVSFNKNKDGNYEFSVEDFGIGIGAHEVENIIKKYGKSTKRQVADQLGAFGLGFKSPLAYTSSFYFTGRKDGIERKYMMYESENEANKIDLLYETPTTERNGVKITVPVKYADSSEFRLKIKEQLAYFEGVFFQCDDVKNDFKIIRGTDYQWSELCKNNYLHICLDNVYYPIDFDKLGIPTIYFPIGLRFSLSDGIYPIPNRESIKYTKEAKDIILEKIKKVANYFVTKYNDTIKDTDDPRVIIEFFRRPERAIPHFNGKELMDTLSFKSYGTVNFTNPKLKGVKLIEMKRLYEIRDFMFQDYTRIYQYFPHNSRFKSIENNKWSKGVRYDDSHNVGNYVFSGVLTQTKKSYIKSELLKNSSYSYFLRKDKSIPLGTLKLTGGGIDNYIKLLELHNHPKKEWRERIKELQYVTSLFTSKFIQLGEIEVPKTWLDGVKDQKTVKLVTLSGITKAKRVKVTGEVSGKISQPLERYVDGKNCKFVPVVKQMGTAHKSPYIVIYGDASNEEKFQNWYQLVHKEKVKFMIFSERELKKLSEIKLHNWIKMEDFEKGKHIVFKRAATAFLINSLINKYTHTFNKADVWISPISTPLSEDLKELKRYSSNYYVGASDKLQKAIKEFAEDKNLFDTAIYDVFKRVVFILDRLPFFEAILRNVSYYGVLGDDTVCALKDLCKYHKQRIDWQNYNLPLNEEKVEVLTEEEIEQLV